MRRPFNEEETIYLLSFFNEATLPFCYDVSPSLGVTVFAGNENIPKAIKMELSIPSEFRRGPVWGLCDYSVVYCLVLQCRATNYEDYYVQNNGSTFEGHVLGSPSFIRHCRAKNYPLCYTEKGMPLDFFTFSCPLFEEKFPCEPPVVWNWRVSSLVASLDFGPFLSHELLDKMKNLNLFRERSPERLLLWERLGIDPNVSGIV